MTRVTIFHNPNCGTSRNVLAMIREHGIEPEVVQYLKTPPSREKLRELAGAMGTTVRGLLRQKGTPYDEMGLDNPALSAGLVNNTKLERFDIAQATMDNPA